MTKGNIHTIFVKLLGEDIDVWRPVSAEKISEDIFKILPIEYEAISNENWEFAPNEVVLCTIKNLEGDNVLVAIRKAGP